MDSNNMKVTPRRPYILRAFYDWLLDNNLTPYVMVSAALPGVRVPEQFIQDGQIILNIAQSAVRNLEISNEAITFNARFGGQPHSVIVPMFAVQAIYAKENGSGTMFEPEEAYINNNLGDNSTDNEMPDLGVVDEADGEFTPEPDDEPPRPKGKPSLRVIK